MATRSAAHADAAASATLHGAHGAVVGKQGCAAEEEPVVEVVVVVAVEDVIAGEETLEGAARIP